MKKLMIAAAIAVAGIAANAASYAWSNPYGLDAIDGGNDTAMFEGTVYLMNDADIARDAFINTVLGADNMGTAFATQIASAFQTMDIADMEMTWDSDTYPEYSKQTFYVAAFDSGKDAVYVSEMTEPLGITSVGGVEAIFFHDAAYAGTAYKEAKEFVDAGWYTAATPTEPTPEPTSGLLMLVGLAGLALRRRHA